MKRVVFCAAIIFAIACERQEFLEKNTDWKAHLNLEGQVYTICESGDTANIDEVTALPGNQGKLQFNKDGSGINDLALDIFTDSTFSWTSTEDTLTLTLAEDSLFQYNFSFVLVKDPDVKGKLYKACYFARGLPCFVDYTYSNSYLHMTKK